MSKWKTYSYEALYTLPRSPGVYAIYKYGLLEYIGSSVNLRRKLRGHVHLPALGPLWDRRSKKVSQLHPEYTIKVRTAFRTGEWLMSEYRLVHRLGPRLNMLHAKRIGTPLAKNVNTFRESRSQAYTASMEAIRLAQELTANGLTRIEVCKRLNREGYRDSENRRWTELSINYLVTNLPNLQVQAGHSTISPTESST